MSANTFVVVPGSPTFTLFSNAMIAVLIYFYTSNIENLTYLLFVGVSVIKIVNLVNVTVSRRTEYVESYQLTALFFIYFT
jgi:hypothetical protein